MTRRAAAATSKTARPKTRRRQADDADDVQAAAAARASIAAGEPVVPWEQVKAQAAHPGVLAAHAGPVTEQECAHPAARRDPKNPGRCCACTAVDLDPPPARRR